MRCTPWSNGAPSRQVSPSFQVQLRHLPSPPPSTTQHRLSRSSQSSRPAADALHQYPSMATGTSKSDPPALLPTDPGPHQHALKRRHTRGVRHHHCLPRAGCLLGCPVNRTEGTVILGAIAKNNKPLVPSESSANPSLTCRHPVHVDPAQEQPHDWLSQASRHLPESHHPGECGFRPRSVSSKHLPRC